MSHQDDFFSPLLAPQCQMYAFHFRWLDAKPAHAGVELEPERQSVRQTHAAKLCFQQREIFCAVNDHLQAKLGNAAYIALVENALHDQDVLVDAVPAQPLGFFYISDAEHIGCAQRFRAGQQAVAIGIGLDNSQHFAQGRILTGNFQIMRERAAINGGNNAMRHRLTLTPFIPGGHAGYRHEIFETGMFAHEAEIQKVFIAAKTVFVNAVMGFMPYFHDGTIALDELIDKNPEATKLYGGGDTLQELKRLLPGLYIVALDDPKYYIFTGGGAVLKAIQEGSVLGIEPIKALIKK